MRDKYHLKIFKYTYVLKIFQFKKSTWEHWKNSSFRKTAKIEEAVKYIN